MALQEAADARNSAARLELYVEDVNGWRLNDSAGALVGWFPEGQRNLRVVYTAGSKLHPAWAELSRRELLVTATAVISGPSGVALVDPGPSSSLAGLRSGLAPAGITIGDVTAILITHIHLDHSGGVLFGGGAEFRLPIGVFIAGSVERFGQTGQRVVVSNGTQRQSSTQRKQLRRRGKSSV